ncbi:MULTISPECIES: hypothetical protein [Pseudomonas]|nr:MULTISPECIES: hypothetical protein [Pseudomonas]KAA3538437.1 hypothetical protein DXU85_21210 [Pseudomonas savastanoi]KWS75374.1 hypothetical protein AL053_19285 [Pseudomonas savastanoi pv. fraxini]MBA4706431.1 hypothetical protein [Pseudomonas savastanoi pv. savastanoi]TSC35162.1 hypothetical protein FOM00_21065 [Pseudomonas sp. ST1]UKL10802.1 hypothetical protein HQ966_05010 [Pseudomonas savastanoi pv. savastanoi]
MHLPAMGSEAFHALKSGLGHTAAKQADDGYITLRHGMRWHIVSHLQRLLIDDGYATPMMRDDFFAANLGL